MLTKLTIEQADEVRALRRDGASFQTLAQAFGCSFSTIRNVLDFEDYGKRRSVSRPDYKAPRLTKRRKVALTTQISIDERRRVDDLRDKLQLPMAEVLMRGIALLEAQGAQHDATKCNGEEPAP